MVEKRLDTMGLSLSPLAIGCEPLGKTDWGFVNISECKKAIKKAYEEGVNVFDTADVYGLGRSEKELSKALGKNRHNAFIISKFGIRWKFSNKLKRAKTFKDSTPQHVINAIENSLRRLRLETIPLYLVHWPDDNTPLEDTLLELEKARKSGKILNYGLSNFSFDELNNVVDKFPISAIQAPYNLAIDNSKNKKLFKLAQSKGLSIFSYGPLAQGLLSGKYDGNSKFEENDRRHRLKEFSKENFKLYKNILIAISSLAEKKEKLMAQISIRWCIDSGYIYSTIVGIKNQEQYKINFKALEWKLTSEEWKYLEKISNKNSINF